jgi:uncharacterized protein (TIGR02996 family)
MKYPCKHALALLFRIMRQPDVFRETTAVSRDSPLLEDPLPLKPPTTGPTEAPKDEGEALWQAIFAEPEEQAHRLVYADWLDERGEQALAQFIRVQCEIERGAEGERLEELREQEERLLAKNRTKWMADVPQHLRGKVGMRGGFVGHLELPVKSLLKYGPALFDRYPIHSVLLFGPYPRQETGRLAVEPFWARARSLWLCEVPTTALEALLSGVFLRDVRRLDLSENGIASRGCALLAAWPGMKGLADLNLGDAGVTDGAVAALCSGGPAALTRLDLFRNSIGNAGAEALAGCPSLSGLRELDLDGNKIGPKGARALAASPHLAGLRRLDLSGNPITDQGARAVAESPSLSGLTSLRLALVELSDEAAAALRERFGDRLRLY